MYQGKFLRAFLIFNITCSFTCLQASQWDEADAIEDQYFDKKYQKNKHQPSFAKKDKQGAIKRRSDKQNTDKNQSPQNNFSIKRTYHLHDDEIADQVALLSRRFDEGNVNSVLNPEVMERNNQVSSPCWYEQCYQWSIDLASGVVRRSEPQPGHNSVSVYNVDKQQFASITQCIQRK